MLKFLFIKPIFIFVLLFYSFVCVWAQGKQEEKYYIILDQPYTYHARMLEKSLYDFARTNDKSIVVHYPSKHNFKNKLSLLKIGTDQKFPVLIFQYYEPDIVSQLTEIYYKTGEFTSTGYMGSFIFLDAFQSDARPISLQLPWSLYSYDSKYIVSEISEVLRTVSQQATQSTTGNVQNIQLLYIVDTISDKELTFKEAVKMQFVDSDTTPQNPTVLQFTMDSAADEISKDTVFTHTFNVKNNAQGTTQNENTDLYTPLEIFDTFINALESDNTTIIVTLNENITNTIHALIRDHYKSLNTSPPPYSVISWGANPEYAQGENKNVILSFEVDYQAYVRQIMIQAAALYNKTLEYVFTEEMIINKGAIQSFSSESIIVPVKAIRY